MPLALRSPIGGAFPGVFAVGMTLPLLAFAARLANGVATAKGYVASLGRFEAKLRPIAAVLLAAGRHDTVVYWFV